MKLDPQAASLNDREEGVLPTMSENGEIRVMLKKGQEFTLHCIKFVIVRHPRGDVRQTGRMEEDNSEVEGSENYHCKGGS